eukprot:CAMPEP_0175836514 /NCGR_PEP_ID=MMETSP0107_2-20121207/17181_1 /TAXON_ID=195067 ORGANISM="Goniomonas pacifica, Strain CCMP1869" /NCGR_SAMPLE_ID=MMETSP0107_2 /ASSEMBLY_ACC=CAM_ASM_000203 /LENGTH=270 /DNA_ID=CAMNT_0017149909 /DNA_START=19 /DNA_END=832 /DNA_ORIENTATION=+
MAWERLFVATLLLAILAGDSVALPLPQGEAFEEASQPTLNNLDTVKVPEEVAVDSDAESYGAGDELSAETPVLLDEAEPSASIQDDDLVHPSSEEDEDLIVLDDGSYEDGLNEDELRDLQGDEEDEDEWSEAPVADAPVADDDVVFEDASAFEVVHDDDDDFRERAAIYCNESSRRTFTCKLWFSLSNLHGVPKCEPKVAGVCELVVQEMGLHNVRTPLYHVVRTDTVIMSNNDAITDHFHFENIVRSERCKSPEVLPNSVSKLIYKLRF